MTPETTRLTFYVDAAIYPAVLGYVLTKANFTASWFILAALGFVLFTLAEYWVHRSLLHRWFYEGSHERHHLHPEEYSIIWYVPFLFVVFYLIMPLPVFAGFTACYILFYSWHHLLHHVDLSEHPFIARYSKWHLLHHKFIRCNFGITSPVWDVVFGTYRSGPKK